MAKTTKAAPTPRTTVKHRDAESGQFVTEKFANKHPKTTIAEHVAKPGESLITHPTK